MDSPPRHFKLSQVLNRIRQIIDEAVSSHSVWIVAEISSVNFHKSGHCYLDLSENEHDKIIAKSKGIIWQRDLYQIEQVLGADLKHILKPGNEILFHASISFTELYGFSLHISTVDLSYTLGNLEKRKQEVINRLKSEKLLDINKQKKVPTIIQKIALIGSPNTSGHTDILEQLTKNQFNYKFQIVTFQCAVQGDKAELEIVSNFNKLQKLDFDIIAIIRGGGSKLDLEVFNSYEIAKAIANSNKPVWTGIGHETDFSICDMVANLHHKTPSALGSYIVEKNRSFEVAIITTFSYIHKYGEHKIHRLTGVNDLALQYITSEPITKVRRKRGDLHTVSTRIVNVSFDLLKSQDKQISEARQSLESLALFTIKSIKNNLISKFTQIESNVNSIARIAESKNAATLDRIAQSAADKIETKITKTNNILQVISAYDPSNILRKGYSIVRLNGVLLQNQQLKIGQELEIETKDRKLSATFNKEK